MKIRKHTGTLQALHVDALVLEVLVKGTVEEGRKEVVSIGDDMNGFGRRSNVSVGIDVLGQGDDGDRQEVLERIDVAIGNPHGMTIVEPVDSEVQVNIEVIIGIVMLSLDPLEFLPEVDLGVLVGGRGTDGAGLERVKVDHALGHGHHVLPNILAEGEGLQARDDVMRIVHCVQEQLVRCQRRERY